METLLLPVAFSPETPEGFTPQETPQGLGNFAEVLEKQYFKEENPFPEDPKISPEEPASSAMAHSFMAAIWAPNGTAFPQENPPLDQVLPAAAGEEGSPAPYPVELSSLFILSKPSPGSESGAAAVSLNGKKTGPLPEETPLPTVTQDRGRGALPTSVFFASGKDIIKAFAGLLPDFALELFRRPKGESDLAGITPSSRYLNLAKPLGSSSSGGICREHGSAAGSGRGDGSSCGFINTTKRFRKDASWGSDRENRYALGEGKEDRPFFRLADFPRFFRRGPSEGIAGEDSVIVGGRKKIHPSFSPQGKERQ
jgi:hypothetical protein